MHVVIAPDSFGGTLSAPAAARAIAEGWRRARPDDTVVACPMSDGGEGLLEVLTGPEDATRTVEVVGPLGHPREARLTLSADGTAIVESAQACGLRWLEPGRRDPLRATTWGVGQLLDAAREAGARRILVGLGGSATVDGGAGALSGLGFRLTVADGSGLKIGGGDLARVAAAAPGWRAAAWPDLDVVLLADVATVLADAARVYGPQKGATPDAVATLSRALRHWADIAERDLAGRRLRYEPGSGAAGGLGFGLAAGLGASIVPGAGAVADRIGLDAALDGADLVVTGEGRLDETSLSGKVVGEVVRRSDVPVVAVVGSGPDHLDGLGDVERAAPDGPGPDPSAQVLRAAVRLAGRRGGTAP